MRLFFRLLYHPFAWAYDAVAWIVSSGMWNDWVLSILPYVQGLRVLEIGPGPGHLLVALNHARYHVTGLDESRDMLLRCVDRLSVSGVELLCVNGYAQLMPFPSDYFNTICATFPSEYILDPKTIYEASRVLVSGGRLVILPSAWFADTYPPGQLLTPFFRATGQNLMESDVYAQSLQSFGFLVSTEIQTLAHSQTLIILAIKPNAG